MKVSTHMLNGFVAAFLSIGPVFAQGSAEQSLLEQLKSENWSEAESALFDLWSRSGSPAMDLLLRRGVAAFEDGVFHQALDHLTALTDHAPEFSEGWFARARVFYEQGNLGLAADDLRRALALNPDHFAAWLLLGRVAEDTERPALARRAYEHTRSIHPNIPFLEDAISRVRLLSGDFEI